MLPAENFSKYNLEIGLDWLFLAVFFREDIVLGRAMITL